MQESVVYQRIIRQGIEQGIEQGKREEALFSSHALTSSANWYSCSRIA